MFMLALCLLTPDKSAVLITVTYPLSTVLATVVGELERDFESASTDGVFIDAQSAVVTASFNNDFTTSFIRVVDVTNLTIYTLY